MKSSTAQIRTSLPKFDYALNHSIKTLVYLFLVMQRVMRFYMSMMKNVSYHHHQYLNVKSVFKQYSRMVHPIKPHYCLDQCLHQLKSTENVFEPLVVRLTNEYHFAVAIRSIQQVSIDLFLFYINGKKCK